MPRLDQPPGRKKRRGAGKKSKPGDPAASGARGLHTRVKSAKGRRQASTLWLQRQLNDPYVAAAQRDGYRSRAAYKLIELDDRFHLFAPGTRVLDLGAAPGSWAQVAVSRINADGSKGNRSAKGTLLGIDLLEMVELPGADLITLDFLSEDAEDRIKDMLGGPVDVVLSDMAAPVTGHRPTDHLRTLSLCEDAFQFACQILRPGGSLVAKIFQGGTEKELLFQMRQRFSTVKHAKPKASRAESSESYVVALGFEPSAD